MSQGEKLTRAQREALELLAEQGKPIGAWKRRTQVGPVPRLNGRAASSLADKRLARTHFPSHGWSPYTNDYRYTITDAGREALRDP